MNKSLTLVFALTVTTTLVQAQTSAGNMMVGGTIDFTSVSREGGSLNDASSFTFSPSFGYFISDNLAIGSSLTLSSWRQGTGSAKTVTTGFGIGPFVRYYKLTSNDRFAIFGEAGLGFGTDKTDPAVGNVTHSNYITFTVAPGAAFFFNEHWAFEMSITGFGITSRDPDTDNNDDKVTTVNLGLSSFSPELGFRYHF